MQVQYVAENECPNFAGLYTTKVIKSHVKLHVKSDAQKVNFDTAVTSSLEQTFLYQETMLY